MHALAFAAPAARSGDAARAAHLTDLLVAACGRLDVAARTIDVPGALDVDELPVLVDPAGLPPGWSDALDPARTLAVGTRLRGAPGEPAERTALDRCAARLHVDLRVALDARARGVHVTYMPLRHDPGFAAPDRGPSDTEAGALPRPAAEWGAAEAHAGPAVDEVGGRVVLLGAGTPRRAAWRAEAAARADGPRIAAPGGPPPGPGDVAVLLHAHEDVTSFDWYPALRAIAAGAAVVAEHATDAAPLRPGRDVLLGRAAGLADLAALLHEDTGRRDALAASALALLRAAPDLDASAGLLVGAAWELAAGTWRGERRRALA